MPIWRITNQSQQGETTGLLLKEDGFALLKEDGGALLWQAPEASAFWPLIASMDITDSRPCALATFTGQTTGDVLAVEDEVWVEYAEDDENFVKVFAGDVSVLEDTYLPDSTEALFNFTARDYTARLDWTVIEDGVRPQEEASERLAWLVGLAPTHGITGAGVDSINTVLAEHDYTGSTKREAYDHIAQVLGAYYYVDFEKDLQFFITRTTPAAFDLSTSPSAPDSYTYRDFTVAEDATVRADYLLVQGEEISLWRPSDPPGTTERQAALNDPNIRDYDTAVSRGDAELDLIDTSEISGSLVTIQPGLHAGDTVHIVNAPHGLDDDYLITSVRVIPLTGSPEEGGEDAGRAFFQVEFAEHYACRRSPQPETLAPDPYTKAVLALPSYDYNDVGPVTLAWGRKGGVYVFYPGTTNVGHLFRVNHERMVVKLQRDSLGAGPLYDHVPDDGNRVPRPLAVGSKFILPNGRLAYTLDLSGGTMVGAAAQNWPRYWTTELESDETTRNLRIRSAATGSVISSLLDCDYSYLRGSPSGQYVAAKVDLASPEQYDILDRNGNLVTSITLPESLPADLVDWTIDSEFNLYFFGTDGILLKLAKSDPSDWAWTRDLTSESPSFYPSTVDGYAGEASPSALYIDGDMLLVAGYVEIGPDDYSDFLEEAALASVNRATGRIAAIERFGSTNNPPEYRHEATAVVRATTGGPLFLVGWSDVSVHDDNPTPDFEGVEVTGVWVMRLSDVPSGGGLTLDDVTGGTFSGDAGDVPFTPAGTISSTNTQAAVEEVASEAASALSTHAGAADPHTGYRLESADHSHASTGLQGGQIDHANLANVTATQHHSNANDPSSGEKAALAGTSGTPGSGNKYVTDADSRLTDSRAPTGSAGGVLSGTYPNPSFAADMATQAELDAHTGDTSDAHDASAISILDSGNNFTATDVEAALAELAGAGGGSVATDAIWDAAGDLAVGTGSNTAARLALGAIYKALVSDGSAALWALRPVMIDQSGAPNDIVNVATEQTLYSFSIPAGLLGSNGSVRVRIQGDYLNNTAANRTLNIKVKLGSTTLFDDTTGNIGANAARRRFFIDLVLGNCNSASVQDFTAHVSVSAVTAATAGQGDMAGNQLLDRVIGGSAAEDTSSAKTLTVTVTHSTNDANLSIRRLYACAIAQV